MKMLLAVLTLVGFSLAAPSREKRQAGCISAFQSVPNVCKVNPNGQVYFSHPSDPTKFLQCDVYGRMYITQCPQGEGFNLASSACQAFQTQPLPQVTVTRAPVYTPPPTPSATTHPPPTAMIQMTPTPQSPMQPVANNPCSPQSVALGQLYFPYPNDQARFIMCDLQGNPSVLSCPQLLVWDQSILACIYRASANQGQNQAKPTSLIPAGQANNPCSGPAIRAGRLYFPHLDPTKFIQCDLWGDAFTVSCPTNLVWNAALETCYSPYVQTVP